MLFLSNDQLKINEKIVVGTGTPYQRHKTGQQHLTAAKQIVPEIFLEPLTSQNADETLPYCGFQRYDNDILSHTIICLDVNTQSICKAHTHLWAQTMLVSFSFPTFHVSGAMHGLILT